MPRGVILLLCGILFLGSYAVVGLLRPDLVQAVLVKYYDRFPFFARANPFLSMVKSPEYVRAVRIFAVGAFAMTVAFIAALIRILSR